MQNEQVEQLLPHSPPMVFISDIENVDLEAGTLRAKISIKPTDIMYQESLKGVPSCAAIEYMAQAIGCFVGYSDQLKGINEPSIGFVLGTRKLSVFIPVFAVNETYYIDIKIAFCDESIASFDCIIYKDDKIVAEATLNAFRPTDIKEFMEVTHD